MSDIIAEWQKQSDTRHDANGTEIEVVTLPTTDGQLVIYAMPYDWQSVTRKARDLAERQNKE